METSLDFEQEDGTRVLIDVRDIITHGYTEKRGVVNVICYGGATYRVLADVDLVTNVVHAAKLELPEAN